MQKKNPKRLFNRNVGKGATVEQRVKEMTKTVNGEQTGAELPKGSLAENGGREWADGQVRRDGEQAGICKRGWRVMSVQ